jgi:hypothetical protein
MALMAATTVIAGCGGEARHSNSVDIKTYPVQTVEVQGNQPRHCKGLSKPKQAAERKRLERDLQQLRVAIKTIKGRATYGNPIVNKAVDQFERDVAEEALPIHQRARFIDLAAAIVAPRCYWCFQVLESNRPIAGGGKLACG